MIGVKPAKRGTYETSDSNIYLISLSFGRCISQEKNFHALVGDVGQVVAPLAAAYVSYSKDDPEGTAQLIKTYVGTYGSTFVLKHLINSKRPDGGKYSFPSGHTSSAASPAAFLADRYG